MYNQDRNAVYIQSGYVVYNQLAKAVYNQCSMAVYIQGVTAVYIQLVSYVYNQGSRAVYIQDANAVYNQLQLVRAVYIQGSMLVHIQVANDVLARAVIIQLAIAVHAGLHTHALVVVPDVHQHWKADQQCLLTILFLACIHCKAAGTMHGMQAQLTCKAVTTATAYMCTQQRTSITHRMLTDHARAEFNSLTSLKLVKDWMLSLLIHPSWLLDRTL